MFGKTIGWSLALAGLAAGMTGCSKPQAQQMPPPVVVVMPVEEKMLAAKQTYVGQAVAYDEVNLVARVEGYLRQRNFAEGASVKKGDLLFLIEPDNYKAELDAAKAKLQEAKVAVRDANFEYQRHKLLLAKDANSKREYEVAETTKMKAEAQELQAIASLETAQLNMDYTEIRAPFDGRMGMAKFSVGNLVGPSSGTLATIVRNDLIKVDFYVSESLITTHMQKGVIVDHKDTTVVPWLILPNGTTYSQSGTLESLDNKILDGTGTVLVRAMFPNPKNLIIPGMYVKVILESKEKVSTLLVPAVAVQEDQEGAFVMTVDEKNIVHSRHVTVDNTRVDMLLIVKTGLKAGERVIVDGLQKVREGIPVTALTPKQAAAMSAAKPAAGAPGAATDKSAAGAKAK